MENAKAQGRLPATMAQKFVWLKAILRNRALSGSAKNVAAALMTFHNDRTGQCNPSQQRLAEAVGLSRVRVNRLVAELKAGGWIETEGTPGASNYRLMMDHAADAIESGGCDESEALPVSDLTYPCFRDDVGGVSDLTYPYVESETQNHTRNHPEERSKETTHLNPAPAEAASAPVPLNDNQPAVETAIPGQPETTYPAPANDEGQGWVVIAGLKIPTAMYREWTETFSAVDVRATVLKLAPWALSLPDNPKGRQLKATQTRLGKLHEEARQNRLDRKEAKVADAEAGIERCEFTGRNLTKMRSGQKDRFQW